MRAPIGISCRHLAFVVVCAATISLAVLTGQVVTAVADPGRTQACPTVPLPAATTDCPPTSSTTPSPTSSTKPVATSSIRPSPTTTTPKWAPVTQTTPRPTYIPTTPAADDSSGAGVLVVLLLLMCAVVLLAAVLTVANRRRGLDWMKAHVTVASRSGPAATFDTHPDDDRTRDHVIAIVPVAGHQSTTIEEIRS